MVIEYASVGIETVKRAGMKIIALTTTYIKEELNKANLIIKDLSYMNVNDIKKLLGIKII